MEKCDVFIVGAGPAGYTAAIYASRYKLKTILMGEELGGQVNEAHLIENYPGFPQINGRELMEKFAAHAKSFSLPVLTGKIERIEQQKDYFLLTDFQNKEYAARAVILALGMSYRPLNIKGEKEFIGKGVSYCFTCDGFFFRQKKVAVVGGANSAAMAANFLANICEKVYLIFRRPYLTAEPAWQERVKNNPKITLVPETNIQEIAGQQQVEKIILDRPFQGKKELAVNGVFIEIGSQPRLELIKSLDIKTDEKGYILVSARQETNLAGVFAAGDITTNSAKFRQIITAAAEGALAAKSAYDYLQQN